MIRNVPPAEANPADVRRLRELCHQAGFRRVAVEPPREARDR
jgi:hypothetical protein